MTTYAHTLENAEPDAWQTLEEHSEKVADLAACFSEPFKASAWGRAVGLLHDIGKHSPEFQKRLTGENGKAADHKGAGARLFEDLQSGFGRVGAYCIAGHHRGLPDFYGTKNGKSLGAILSHAKPLPEGVANPLEGMPEPEFPFALRHPFQVSFFTRMLFSALVDADFLDTEAFMEAEKGSWRIVGPSLEELGAALDRKLAAFDKPGRINGLRAEILTHCRSRAALEPGLFTLTVPTGGGKTLSSMAFALDHARRHGKRRIVYVVPYTSIIEQNAQVFREIFPLHSVIEHHSTFDARLHFLEDGGDESPAARRHRLACENWDSPVVVTTNVQFFESLFAAKPSRCRKLHNLADAVIILDEAQMLPVEFMNPCLRALEELAAHYGASVVLCTATQPALRKEDFACGLEGLGDHRELAPDPQRMHEAFRRTELHDCGDKSLQDVADMVRERDQVLCIVNTRARAAELFGLVRGEPGARHLSAVMCPAHRSESLAAIRRMLSAGQPCRVVSTQLVEAGVDVSFPEVIREIAGLDSITQAAGRCNREGEHEALAPVSIFNPVEGLPRVFNGPARHTESVLRSGKDPFSPEAITQFFKLHYWLQKDVLDKKRILDDLSDGNGQWSFREAAKKFRLIESPMVPIIIPFNARAAELVNALRFAEHHGGILRKLQQYTVQVYEQQFAALDGAGAVEWVAEAYAVLCRMEYYDEMLGLTLPG
ncbi:MAG: CRISPR-associated helicase Cas3', partial [Pseudodesulfovibrio sp.]